MSNKNLEDNPFSALFSNVIDAENFSEHIQISDREDNMNSNLEDIVLNNQQNENNKPLYVNKVIESVFAFTINRECTFNNIVYLEDLASSSKTPYLNEENLGTAIFERLLLDDPEKYLINRKNSVNYEHACEKNLINYLFHCFEIVHNLKSTNPKVNNINDNLLPTMEDLLIVNASTCLKQPDIFPIQQFGPQILSILCNDLALLAEDFFTKVVQEVARGNSEEEIFNELKTSFTVVLNSLHVEIAQSKLFNFKASFVRVLRFFSNNTHLARVLLMYTTPRSKVGISYSDTIIGSVLCLSCLPKTQNGPYEFYDNVTKQRPASIDWSIWSQVKPILDSVYDVFHNMLTRGPEVKSQTLTWICDCIHANASRGKLWNSFNVMVGSSQSVSDAFMLNFESVLLRFCKPFCENNNKFLLIDPTYCAVTDSENKVKLKKHHAKGLFSETCLIPTPEGKSRPESDEFKFITECFFLTHKALDIGFRVAYEKLVKQNQDIAQMQHVLQDAESQGGGNSDVFQNLTERMDSATKQYFSLRGALLEPDSLNLMAKLHVTTAKWLVQVALDVEKDDTKRSSYCPRRIRDVEFPLPQEVPETLMCVPEFLIENMACFLSFARRFSPNSLEEYGFEFLNPILTMVLVFMGSPERANNPHLRARLAECLESILPHHKEEGPEMNPNPFGNHHRERLFLEHPLRLQIIPTLLNVFVSIEMTGQSVAFEQKFNYRRHMYIIMDYLWNIEEHQYCFINLAEEAEANMEATNPPLFLRFINLLMNDAIFLLDEALSNMAELRTMESQRENRQWNQLPASERESNESNFHRTEYNGFMSHWARPKEIPYPKIWETFEGLKPLANGLKPKFYIQDITEDTSEDVVNFVCINFLGNWPISKKINLSADPLSLEEAKDLWRNTIKERLSLAAFVEGDGKNKPEIAGVNTLEVVRKNDVPKQFRGSAMKTCYGVLSEMERQIDFFEKFDVNEYISGNAFIVDQKYYGQGVGTELLKARLKVVRELGFRLTVGCFTTATSVAQAKNVGFEEIASIPFEKIHGGELFKTARDKYFKVMVVTF